MSDFSGARVCIYARVSTSRQAKNDLSIPDQIERGERWCEQMGATVVETVVEPGASAMDDDRPHFQQMIARATGGERPFDIILVHSLSRLFRNAMHFMQYRATLKFAKVRIVSITQSFGDDPASELALGMLAMFDEYTSLENAKHTQRAMLANAKLGFWNGQTPPLGYRTYEATRLEGKSKRKLEVNEDEAYLVRKIFELYVQGPPGGGPLGVTRVAIWLNENGYKLRGKPFHVSNVQTILRNTAYVGVAFYNKRDSKTGERRPETEWIGIPVPPIVDTDQFDAAQAKLVDHRPQNQSARVTTTENFLVGLARCGCNGDGCGGAMTNNTSKSGQYKYYACSNRARSGTTVCKGRRIPMPRLDEIVLNALETRLLAPERLHELLSGWLDHSQQATAGRREKLRQLRTRQTTLEGGLERLLDLVVAGEFTASNPIFAKKNADLTEQLAHVKTDIVMLERQLEQSERSITPELIDRFAALMRGRLRSDDVALRQFYARSILTRVEVGKEEIRLVGSRKALEHAASRTHTEPMGVVPNIERKWRTRQDSNLWPLPSEGQGLTFR